MFVLNERLENDTVFVGRMRLCAVLLMKDSNYPWLILVPERKDIREMHELTKEDRLTLVEEIACVSRIMEEIYRPDKINIGALGNLVPQLHIHIIARFRKDRAWPGPVWGNAAPEPYSGTELAEAVKRLRSCLDSYIYD
jgi:diadenosine tetraphosphate (Ap4A) HIT family hydrolase